MKSILFVVFFVSLAGAPLGAQPASPGAGVLRQRLTERLDTIATGLDGVMGYTVIDLTTADRIERLPNHLFPTASSIKLAILYELFKQAEEGRVQIDAPRPWDATRAVGGSGVLSELSNPTLNLRDYATLMVVLSDNTATNVVIDAVGIDRVNTRMQALGAGDIQLRRRMIDLEAARKGNENVATTAALARLLIAIDKGEGLTSASRDAMLQILKKGKSSAMLRGIPPGVTVASKPGDLDAVRADAGIVYVPGRPYVFVAMTSWLQKDDDGERAIEEASRAAYQYFERLATASEYGRRIR
jgi:beta-lactamase class A